ncbi:MAG: 3'-phosphoesterase [Omnitrophica bacterium RIFCSPLOWO2_02_FULL_45_16]|nr:MAG: 3'-phosphoesterase [Omnitrophica bacterium RIFCSPHIGHO2_02_FULL_46_20]OGW94230.1 MAG: 3'-phosphoesterase [Omnitrophica bacterium RIFCSPLOWO2_12_FULL_45_13]OGW94774.1 MAG: 3'-phosphoesterase [Omnitrophica bacterium RIFCSPLOWO2_01_FULL_45_24]OGX01028.1 MAG: 3'-phosphoesterase [Omnitrophica bacterium RIFCSPLOWO2_02_FULL_45_16]
MARFVIQEHRARKLHYDFRLEMDGVLKSWAVPKVPSKKADLKRLAIQVEDHDLSYINFEGKIEEGSYGAGTVTVWDNGTYELESRKDNKIVFFLRGKKLEGRYTLLRMKWGLGQWLLFKTKKKREGKNE